MDFNTFFTLLKCDSVFGNVVVKWEEEGSTEY